MKNYRSRITTTQADTLTLPDFSRPADTLAPVSTNLDLRTTDGLISSPPTVSPYQLVHGH